MRCCAHSRCLLPEIQQPCPCAFLHAQLLAPDLGCEHAAATRRGSASTAAVILLLAGCVNPTSEQVTSAHATSLSVYGLLGAADHLVTVDYWSDTIIDVQDDKIELLEGSIWESLGAQIVLPFQNIWIVLTADGLGVALTAGQEIPVIHRGGAFVSHAGLLGRVDDHTGDGKILQLNDGSRWAVAGAELYRISRWSPPYPALLVPTRGHLVNLKAGARVPVSPVH